MKNKFSLAGLLIIISFTMQFCSKNETNINNDAPAIIDTTNNPNYNFHGFIDSVGLFFSDDDSITFASTPGGYPDFCFKPLYDQQQRMTYLLKYQLPYTNATFVGYKKYEYNDQRNVPVIIKDSTDPGSGGDVKIKHLFYDNQERMIKDSSYTITYHTSGMPPGQSTSIVQTYTVTPGYYFLNALYAKDTILWDANRDIYAKRLYDGASWQDQTFTYVTESYPILNPLRCSNIKQLGYNNSYGLGGGSYFIFHPMSLDISVLKNLPKTIEGYDRPSGTTLKAHFYYSLDAQNRINKILCCTYVFEGNVLNHKLFTKLLLAYH